MHFEVITLSFFLAVISDFSANVLGLVDAEGVPGALRYSENGAQVALEGGRAEAAPSGGGCPVHGRCPRSPRLLWELCFLAGIEAPEFRLCRGHCSASPCCRGEPVTSWRAAGGHGAPLSGHSWDLALAPPCFCSALWVLRGRHRPRIPHRGQGQLGSDVGSEECPQGGLEAFREQNLGSAGEGACTTA